jgi:osmotically-inducible protein OsmY
MKNYLSKFAMFVALCSGIAIAQGMPQQGSQSTPASPSTSSPTQQAPDQTAKPDQSTDQGKNPASSPEQVPKSDENKSSDQSSKLPQSDNAATSTGDVASQVQSALQQDPKLASANITAKVNGNKLELDGTVQSADEKKAAEKIAKDKAGSLKIKNHIKIASSNPAGQDKDKTSNPPKQ